jgi:hypothetical protein
LPTPREVLVATLEDVSQADTPDALLQIAFSKTFDMHAGLSGPAVQTVVAAGGPSAATRGALTTAEFVSGDLLAAIAAKAGTDRDTVAEVFDERNGELELIIGAGKLAASVSAGTKDIALLVAGGRQAAGIEEWTSLDVVREVCAEFKKLDSGNFAKTIKAMTNEFNVRKESERKTVVRVSRPGWDAFSALVVRLAGAS